MESMNYYFYRIEASEGTLKLIKKKNKEGDFTKVNTFEKPITNKGLSKLYIVKHESEIIYVGIASQPMRSRLRNGFKAAGKHGYHGYQWKKLRSFDLIVWWFPNKTLKQVEAVEAEIVYLIRSRVSQWPKYQTEIHFSQVTEDEKNVARQIYEKAIQ